MRDIFKNDKVNFFNLLFEHNLNRHDFIKKDFNKYS